MITLLDDDNSPSVANELRYLTPEEAAFTIAVLNKYMEIKDLTLHDFANHVCKYFKQYVVRKLKNGESSYKPSAFVNAFGNLEKDNKSYRLFKVALNIFGNPELSRYYNSTVFDKLYDNVPL